MDIFVGKLVKGSGEFGNGLVTKVEKVENDEYMSHIIKVSYPKYGHKEIHYIMNPDLIDGGDTSVEFIESSPDSKWKNEDGSIKC